MNPLEHWKSIIAGAAGGGLVLALVIGGLSSGSENPQASEPDPDQTEEVETDLADPEPEELEEAEVSEPPACSLEDLENDPRILQLQAAVINPETNELIYDVGAGVPARTASVMKLVTAAAALETLGPNYRVETRVYADSADPTKLYFVGAGDITLSRTGPGAQSIYRDAPKLSSLAFQVNQYVSTMEPPGQQSESETDPEVTQPAPNPAIESEPFTQEITEIVLDSSLWGGVDGSGQWEKNWNLDGIEDGWMSQASALQVDGDRDEPNRLISSRSDAPVERAGEWFREAIGENAASATLSYGVAPADAVEVASVLSEPIKEWIRIMLLDSDNSTAEALARLIAYDAGFDGSDFESIERAYKSALRSTGLNVDELVIEDGSGLSAYSAVSPQFIARLMELVVEGYPNYENILNALPVAGESGSLSSRFDDGELSNAAGSILAKTGWIRTGYALAGTMTASDGADLTFAVYNLGDVSIANRDALDEFVYGIYECGADLGN